MFICVFYENIIFKLTIYERCNSKDQIIRSYSVHNRRKYVEVKFGSDNIRLLLSKRIRED